MSLKFPKDFLWGAATSSHQVEGNNVNDWTAWEDMGHVQNEQRSGLAADHWNLYEDDFKLLKKLNLNSYRMSIEWSRIEPQPGVIDQEALDHYRKMLKNLKSKKITTIVTLHHFTNPQWLDHWTVGENVKRFNDYVETTVGALGDLVDFWITINEPIVVSLISYLQGRWPPGRKNPIATIQVLGNFARAHNRAYDTIHQVHRLKKWHTPRVSMALNLQHYESANDNPINKIAASVGAYFNNRYFFNKVKDSLDYICVNFYFSHVFGSKQNYPRNDMNWTIYPEGLRGVLNDLKQYDKPIVIAENGIPDSKDEKRAKYIVDHLVQVERAINDGVKVIGYMHWSLIDNFEWAEGYWPRFGLVEVDYETQKRTIRESAKTYAAIAKSNQITEKQIKDIS